jgi:hypothetical protein
VPAKVTGEFFAKALLLPWFCILGTSLAVLFLIPESSTHWLVLKYAILFAFHFALILFAGVIIRRKQLRLFPRGLVNPLTPRGAGKFIIATLAGIFSMGEASGENRERAKLLESGWDIVGIGGFFSGILAVDGVILSCCTDCFANPFMQLIFMSLWGAFAGCVFAQLLTRRRPEDPLE